MNNSHQAQVGDVYRVTDKWNTHYDNVGEIVAIDRNHSVFYCPVWLEFEDGSRAWFSWDNLQPTQNARV